jgi:hypothetical protein
MLLAACAGPQSSKAEQSAPPAPTTVSPSVSPNASATAAPSPSQLSAECPGFTVTTVGAVTASTPLFAVLETRRAGAKESEYSGSHDTVTLAGFDGYAHVKVSFAPRRVPDMSADGAVPILQPEAVLAASAVYVIDGSGVVCRIDRHGTSHEVTTFPITSAHQAVSFAVSPNGTQLMAAVLTYPVFSPGPTAYQPVVSGQWELSLEVAAAGGTAKVVSHLEKAWSNGPFDQNNIVMAGWDGADPIGVVGSFVGGTPGIDGDRWPGDLSVHAVHLGLDGAIGASLGPNGAAIGPNGCGLVSLGPAGAVLCETGGGMGIRPQVDVGTAGGQVLWTSPSSIFASGGVSLSPDESLMAMDGWLVGKSGSIVALPKGFRPRGWLDDRTVIGFVTSTPTSSIGVVRLSSPAVADNWGFSGQFVGVL